MEIFAYFLRVQASHRLRLRSPSIFITANRVRKGYSSRRSSLGFPLTFITANRVRKGYSSHWSFLGFPLTFTTANRVRKGYNSRRSSLGFPLAFTTANRARKGYSSSRSSATQPVYDSLTVTHCSPVSITVQPCSQYRFSHCATTRGRIDDEVLQQAIDRRCDQERGPAGWGAQI